MCVKSSSNWQPALLRGEALCKWAQATAELTVVQKMLEPRTGDTATEIASEISNGMDLATETSPVKGDRQCREGCPGCGHSRISVTVPEVCAIADSLREDRTPEEIDSIRRRAVEIAEESSGMDNTQFAKSMFWCPLLSSGLSCSVYPVRPLVCRAWNSLSRDRCHDCYFANHVTDTIPLDEHAYTVVQGVRAGLSSAIDAAGLDGKSYELSHALTVAIDQPDAAKLWANGENVFENCEWI